MKATSLSSEPDNQHISGSSAPILALPHDVTRVMISPAIQTALNAFRAALQWVAFYGDELIASGKTKTDTYQECLRRRYRRSTFIVRSVEPELLEEVECWVDV